MGGDLFDGFWLSCFAAWLRGLRFGEVEAGDLEAVEEQAGAARVDVVGGYATKNFADGVLDGAAVFRQGQQLPAPVFQPQMVQMPVAQLPPLGMPVQMTTYSRPGLPMFVTRSSDLPAMTSTAATITAAAPARFAGTIS